VPGLRSSGAAALVVAAPLPQPSQDPDAVRAAAREVLARPEYREPAPNILERVRDWVVEQVERALGALLGGGQAKVLAWAVLAAALGVVVFLVVRFTRGVTPDAVQGVQAQPQRHRSAEEWRAEADANARGGRWREAVRCRYRALVAELGTRGLLDEVPGRTAGEYRAEMSVSAPAVAPAFSQASDVFEVAWYGQRPIDEDEDARLRALADHVLSGSA
jgi:Domain of unknown function (DUF4129)